MNTKKSVGIALCGLFGSYVVSSIFNLSFKWFEYYNETFAGILWAVTNIAVVLTTAVVALDKKAFTSKIGNILAWVVCVLYCAFGVNSIVTSQIHTSIFEFLGTYASPILGFLSAAIVIPYLFLMKSWLPIKIVGASVFIPNIVSDFIIVQLNNAWKVMSEYPEQYESYENIISNLEVSNYFSYGLYAAALILTIIWLSKKITAPSYVKNPIEII